MIEEMKPNVSGERARLALVKQILYPSKRTSGSAVVLGVEGMDDGALLRWPIDELLVVASDFVRGTGFHLFQLGYLNYFDIGYYLIAANASDLAAMGAKPIAATTILRYADDTTDEDFVQALEGMKASADQFGLEIIGGDIGGHAVDVFAATVLGSVGADRALRRNGAAIGDTLCVTGVVGRPITALMYFKKAKSAGLILDDEAERRLLASWRRPNARICEGQVLSGLGYVSACQDVSDGLKDSIDQISEASRVSFRIYSGKIPLDEATTVVAQHLDTDPIALAMSASVDFELLFTVPSASVGETIDALRQAGCMACAIGEAIGGTENVLCDTAGTETPLPGLAWQQQTGDYLTGIIREGRRA